MKKWPSLALCAALMLTSLGFSQGIRKNFTEMTSAEKTAYVGALNRLYNSNSSLDIVQTLSNNYWSYFYQVYYSGCDQGGFLHFHRMMIWEMENALQRKNPRLTVPYWDWTVNNSVNDSLFTSFLSLSQLPAGWNLSRNLGGFGSLPAASQIQSIQGYSTFCDVNNFSNSYVDQMESNVDPYVKYWVGGTLGGYNPQDPLFYSHAAMLDKLWEDWQQVHNNSSISLSVLPRYDGVTGSVYISPLPYTNPNNIVDSRQQGIFYASNGVANLDGGYSVTNTYATPEYFSYPNQIVASSFSIGPGKSAVFVSKTGVTLQAPFIMNQGTLEIDVGSSYYDNFPLAKSGRGDQGPFTQPSGMGQDRFTVARSSNGFTARLWLQNSSQVQGYVMAVNGKIVSKLAQSERLESGYHEFQLNLPQRTGALYYAYFRTESQTFKQLLPRF